MKVKRMYAAILWGFLGIMTIASVGAAIPDSPVSSGAVLTLPNADSIATGFLTGFPAANEDYTVEGYFYLTRPYDYSFVLFAKEDFCKIGGTQIWNGRFFETGIFFGAASVEPVEFKYKGPGFPLEGTDINQWHHFALVHEAQETRIYWDGALVAFNTIIETNTLGLPPNLTANTFLKGQEIFLDEIRVSRGVRYATSFIPPSTQLTPDAQTLALWHFDGLSGTTVFEDSSGAGHTLTGINGAAITGFDSTDIQDWMIR